MTDLDLAKLCAFVDISGAGYTSITDGVEVQAYYNRPEKTLVFLGTNTRTDWLKNIWAFKDNGVHMGFRAAWNAIDGLIFNVIGEDKRIIITGHSLGGALAQQAFMALPSGTVRSVVTFGQPRVYGLQMAEAYRSKAETEGIYQQRYVFVDDPTPYTPFGHWGFSHPVSATYLRWWPTSLWAWDRHSMDRYIRALERITRIQAAR